MSGIKTTNEEGSMFMAADFSVRQRVKIRDDLCFLGRRGTPIAGKVGMVRFVNVASNSVGVEVDGGAGIVMLPPFALVANPNH